MQARQSRVDQLSGECEQLEKQNEELENQLRRMQGESDRRGRIEQELNDRLQQLQGTLNDKNEEPNTEQFFNMKRQIVEVEQERKLLEDRLNNSKIAANEARHELEVVETKMTEMARKVHEAEQGRQEAEQMLAQAGSNLGTDNYLKDELNKARKENMRLSEKTKEMDRKVKVLRSERVERSEVVNNYSKTMTDRSTERVVRTQIPLLSGRGEEKAECGEHMVRIRILEQEVERHLRRVCLLEQQLSELEKQHRERTEQLMQERRSERERDHTRHTASLKQLEHSLNSRERMYKERISGLEEQVHLLRDQMSKEARSKKTFISSSRVLSSDVSELRRQLDASLTTVQHSSKAGLEGGLLEREASKLKETIARQGREVVGRLAESRREDSYNREERRTEQKCYPGGCKQARVRQGQDSVNT